MSSGKVPPGVTVLDHTADVAIEVTASDLPGLFDSAAAGMFALIFGAGEGHGEDETAGERGRTVTGSGAESEAVLEVDASAVDLPSALVRWLRELLYLYQSEGLVYKRTEFTTISEDGSLRASVHATPASLPSVREIKGVTYHHLEATRRGDGWYARVVFDV